MYNISFVSHSTHSNESSSIETFRINSHFSKNAVNALCSRICHQPKGTIDSVSEFNTKMKNFMLFTLSVYMFNLLKLLQS